MSYILQVDFPHDGIFGEEFSNAFKDLATDISNEVGLIWKIWTENKEEKINYSQSVTKQQHTFRCKNCGRHVTINTNKQCSNSLKEKLHTRS